MSRKPRATKAQLEAAARARAGRSARGRRTTQEPLSSEARYEESQLGPSSLELLAISETQAQPITEHSSIPEVQEEMEVIVLDDDESDCGYEGGVEYIPSDSELEDCSESERDWSSGEEFEFEEYDEECLKGKDSVFNGLMKTPMSAWSKAEKNRSLGYTGLSRSTKYRKEKERREGMEFRERAKLS